MTQTAFPKTRLTWRRLMRREDGNASLEFAIIFPLFMLIFLSVFEIGMLMTRYMMFDRALDITVREMRLSDNRAFTPDQVKNLLCVNSLIMQNHCLDDIVIEMVRLDGGDADWAFPTGTAPCRDYNTDVVPATAFSQGSPNQVVFVRACLAMDPFFPTAALGEFLTRDTSGKMNMIAQTAFSVEPV